MIKTDFLVIGSGIAGLSFALKAARYGEVLVITKNRIKESNTLYAQGGLAAVFGKDDSFRLHIKDTILTGEGLCNSKAVSLLVRNAPREVLWLYNLGVKFDRNKEFRLSREAVHSKPRIVHAGDITGEKIESTLVKRTNENKKIKILEYNQAIELITRKGVCYGSRVLDIKKREVIDIFAKATILATGGLGQVYKNTCNPKTATGDGFALAYNSGASLQDMEFIQFHPTGLYKSRPTFLISETLRGEGGILRNKYGKPFMKHYHKKGDLAPRNTVSRLSVIEMKKTNFGCVFLDVSHLGSDYLKKRFPTFYVECLRYGIDITKEPIPVTPTAHYSCGGVRINLNGETDIKNLYAIGEVSCSGLHGAERLASNSLTEGLVFSTRLIEFLGKGIRNKSIKSVKNKTIGVIKGSKKVNQLKSEIKKIMWDKVGIIRKREGMKKALKRLDKIEKIVNNISRKGINKEIVELRNQITVAKLITKSALARKESRGSHFVEDYPKKDDKNWRKHSIINKKGVRFC